MHRNNATLKQPSTEETYLISPFLRVLKAQKVSFILSFFENKNVFWFQNTENLNIFLHNFKYFYTWHTYHIGLFPGGHVINLFTVNLYTFFGFLLHLI